MALSYLSGMEDNYLGLAEVGAPRRKRQTSAGRERNIARQAEYKARMERRRAELMMRRARRASENAAMKIQQANATTTEARAISMDEIGRRKSGGGGGGKAARQEARAARATAKRERQQAKVAIRKARAEAKQAQKAAVKAKRATARAARVTARTQAKAARAAAVPAPRIRKRREAPAAAPEIEDIEAEIIEDEAEPEQEQGEEIEEEEETNESIEGFLGMDEIGRRKGKKDRSGKKAARKSKRAAKKDKRGGSIAKKIALAPVRLALFALMKVNALKIRTKLRQAWKKDKNAVNTKLVKKFGFKLDNFLRELNRKENETLSGAEFGSIEAAIATATPALIAVAALLKQLGINPENLGRKGAGGGAGTETGEEVENIPGREEGTPGSNFRLSTPLIIGAAAIAAFFILKKK
jgi:hypothetical protein